jgi:hypothetical protein
MKSLLVGLFVAMCSLGQSEPPKFDRNGAANGRLWTVLTPDHRSWFIFGQQDATKAILLRSVADRFAPRTLSNTEIVAAIDRFYDEPENLPISIMDALMVVTLRANGADSDTVAHAVAQLKRLASAPPKPRLKPRTN